MRFQFFIHFPLVGLCFLAAIMGLDANPLPAEPSHIVLTSVSAPAPQSMRLPAGCGSSAVSSSIPWKLDQFSDLNQGLAMFGESSQDPLDGNAGNWRIGLTAAPRHVCQSASLVSFEPADSTVDPWTAFRGDLRRPSLGQIRVANTDIVGETTATTLGSTARIVYDVLSVSPQQKSEWILGDRLQVPIPIPVRIDFRSWMGFGWLGGSTFPTTTATLHYEPSPWVLQYWQMNGTYVDHVTEPPIADPTSGWGVRVGYVDRGAMYYAGYDWLDYRKEMIVHAGPVIGVQWGSPLQYDVTVRLPYTAKLGNNYQPAWGLGLRVQYDVPLGESVSLSIGYQAWNYWFRPRGWHYWDGVSISLETRP